MYVFDTNVFVELGHFLPKRFTAIWARLDALVVAGDLISVREVRREMEQNFQYEHVLEWANRNSSMFRTPLLREQEIVRDIMKAQVGQELVKRANILKGLPVADPFIIAAAEVLGATVVTEEKLKPNAARIPFFCERRGIPCINLDGVFEREGIRF